MFCHSALMSVVVVFFCISRHREERNWDPRCLIKIKRECLSKNTILLIKIGK